MLLKCALSQQILPEELLSPQGKLVAACHDSMILASATWKKALDKQKLDREQKETGKQEEMTDKPSYEAGVQESFMGVEAVIGEEIKEMVMHHIITSHNLTKESFDEAALAVQLLNKHCVRPNKEGQQLVKAAKLTARSRMLWALVGFMQGLDAGIREEAMKLCEACRALMLSMAMCQVI